MRVRRHRCGLRIVPARERATATNVGATDAKGCESADGAHRSDTSGSSERACRRGGASRQPSGGCGQSGGSAAERAGCASGPACACVCVREDGDVRGGECWLRAPETIDVLLWLVQRGISFSWADGESCPRVRVACECGGRRTRLGRHVRSELHVGHAIEWLLLPVAVARVVLLVRLVLLPLVVSEIIHLR